MPRAKTTAEVLDTFLSTAPKDQLLRLQGDLAAVLRWKYAEQPPAAPARKPRTKKDAAQLPLAKGAE